MFSTRVPTFSDNCSANDCRRDGSVLCIITVCVGSSNDAWNIKENIRQQLWEVLYGQSHVKHRGQKFHSSAHNYELNLEKMSDSSQSTRPIGGVLWEELVEGEGEKSEGETRIF